MAGAGVGEVGGAHWFASQQPAAAAGADAAVAEAAEDAVAGGGGANSHPGHAEMQSVLTTGAEGEGAAAVDLKQPARLRAAALCVPCTRASVSRQAHCVEDIPRHVPPSACYLHQSCWGPKLASRLQQPAADQCKQCN